MRVYCSWHTVWWIRMRVIQCPQSSGEAVEGQVTRRHLLAMITNDAFLVTYWRHCPASRSTCMVIITGNTLRPRSTYFSQHICLQHSYRLLTARRPILWAAVSDRAMTIIMPALTGVIEDLTDRRPSRYVGLMVPYNDRLFVEWEVKP